MEGFRIIIFEELKFQNFLSSGNKFTEIDFLDAKHTLVVGHNGAGKSTMLDALSFALFGKAHRNINKPQLVNSINKKNCVVEVKFKIGKQSYFVKRGINPGIFEIYVNGSMLNQTSTVKDYQKILEQNILKLNHKSFHQIVVLGSSSFVPFMQLPQGHRRAVIEDLLDINVFSKMNYLLRERNSILKDKIRDSGHKEEILETKQKSQKKYIRDLTKLNKDHRKEKEDQVKHLNTQVGKLQEENDELVNKVNTTKPQLDQDLELFQEQRQIIYQKEGEIKSEIKQVVNNAKFYERNTTCPSCQQDIDEETKEVAKEASREKARILSSRQSDLNNKKSSIDTEIQKITEALQYISELQDKINQNITQITSHQKTIQSLESDIQNMDTGLNDLSDAKSELEDIEKKRSDMIEQKFKLSEEYSYNTVMGEMLKDTGIKTKVIKQYVPIINKLVNQYLQVLDFFVSFELDESFSEEIRSRYRDTFSYDSFSEGEKQRIDLALLFTWRQIAKMKNSVATNLLVLDETFDSSLDHDGVENLMKILYTLSDDTNVFVISHKGEILEGKFEKKIEFYKDKNFSVMKKG